MWTALATAALAGSSTLQIAPDVHLFAGVDVDADGADEIAWIDDSRRFVHVFGEREGGWRLLHEVHVAESAFGPATHDIDGDGRTELFWRGHLTGDVYVLWPVDWRLERIGVGYAPGRTCVTDLDEDGEIELLAVQHGFPSRLRPFEFRSAEFVALPVLEGRGGEVWIACSGDPATEIWFVDTHFRRDTRRLYRADAGGVEPVSEVWGRPTLLFSAAGEPRRVLYRRGSEFGFADGPAFTFAGSRAWAVDLDGRPGDEIVGVDDDGAVVAWSYREDAWTKLASSREVLAPYAGRAMVFDVGPGRAWVKQGEDRRHGLLHRLDSGDRLFEDVRELSASAGE